MPCEVLREERDEAVALLEKYLNEQKRTEQAQDAQ